MAKLLSAPSKNAVQKELSAQLLNTAGASDPISFDDVDGIPNLPGVLVINRVDSSGVATPAKREYIEYSGTSGNTVLITTRDVDSSNSALTHAIGSIVEFIPDVTWGGRVYDALSTVIDITDTSVIKSGLDFSTPNISLGVISSSGASISAILDEDAMGSDSSLALATQQSIKAYVDANAGGDWKDLGQTLTYTSADDPTYVATVSGVDVTSDISVGMKIRLSQTTGGTKYFIVTAISFSTDTVITLYGGTDYNLENEAISTPVYSSVKAPYGFPLDITKWTQTTTSTSNSSQASPTQNVWYNLGGNLVIPIGVWDVDYQIIGRCTVASGSFKSTLSTTNNSESDADFSTFFSTTGGTDFNVPMSKQKILSLTAKSTRYLNMKTIVSSASTLAIRGDLGTTVIKAVCIYL